MNFESLSHTLSVGSLLMSLPFDPTDRLTMLVLGCLLGFVVAVFGSQAMTYLSATVVSVMKGCHLAFAVVLRVALQLKNTALSLVTGAVSWKKYRTVMPWRQATSATSHTSKGMPLINKTQPNWYGTETDIDFFLERISDDGDSDWKCISRNSLPEILEYEAFCRYLPGTKTEYKSVTVVKDATAEEMTEFYLNDECRSRWDSMLAKTELLEIGPTEERCEVVRWIRSFPFPFLSDREYVIGRRIFRKDNCIYTVSRGVEHAAAPINPSVVRMDVYYSIWCCRNIVCPWGTNAPACEVTLLHHEQFKIPERLARFAARKGMWSFIKSMGPAAVGFVRSYREAKAGSNALQSTNDFEYHDASAKPGKMARTARRALLASVITAVWLMHRQQKQHKG